MEEWKLERSPGESEERDDLDVWRMFCYSFCHFRLSHVRIGGKSELVRRSSPSSVSSSDAHLAQAGKQVSRSLSLRSFVDPALSLLSAASAQRGSRAPSMIQVRSVRGARSREDRPAVLCVSCAHRAGQSLHNRRSGKVVVPPCFMRNLINVRRVRSSLVFTV